MSFGESEEEVNVADLGTPIYLYDKTNGAYRGRMFERDIPDISRQYHFTALKPEHNIVLQTAFFVNDAWEYRNTVGTAAYYDHFKFVFMYDDWEYYAPSIDGMQYYISVDGHAHLSGRYPTVQVQEMISASKHIIRNDLGIYIMEYDRVLIAAGYPFDGRLSIKF